MIENILKNELTLNSSGIIEVTLFFDYNCIECKKAFNTIKEILEKRNDIKIILKPIPILGDLSVYATEIGHAVSILDPNKYPKYFETLMNTFDYNKPICNILRKNDINIEKLKSVIRQHKSEIDKIIINDLDLADSYGVENTPFFVINNKIINGNNIDYKKFNEELNKIA